MTPAVFGHRKTFVDSFDSVFDKLIQTNFPSLSSEFGVDIFAKGAYPKVNITDFPSKTKIVAEVAGLDKEDVSIIFKEGVLTISGAKSKMVKPEEGGTLVHNELKHSAFKRSWTVNEDVLDCTKCKATFENGLLTLNIPKKEPKAEVFHEITID